VADRADARRAGGDVGAGGEAGDELDDVAGEYWDVYRADLSAGAVLFLRVEGQEGEEEGGEGKGRAGGRVELEELAEEIGGLGVSRR
jgi:hypothetical protein